jgi:hypothetical protein
MILTLQYCLDVSPAIRGGVDYTFILREPNIKYRKLIHENYAGIIPDFSAFCDMMDQIADDYTALVIHNRSQSNKVEDCVFWYKANPAISNNFKLGCDDYWNFHKSRYNPESEE